MTEVDFVQLETSVERRAREGQPLERIEAFIERQPMPDDTKAALWLLAWSIQQQPWSHPIRPPGPVIDAVND